MNGINASKLLNRLEDIYQNSPRNAKNIRPTSICYGSAIKVWAISIDTPNTNNNKNNNNGAIETRRILDRMLTAYGSGNNIWAKPTMISFNSCLHAYTLRGMVTEVEALLRKMETQCEDIDPQTHQKREIYLHPDVMPYTTCINAWVKSSGRKGDAAVKRADDLLQRMLKRYERAGDRRDMPNQYTFSSGKL